MLTMNSFLQMSTKRDGYSLIFSDELLNNEDTTKGMQKQWMSTSPIPSKQKTAVPKNTGNVMGSNALTSLIGCNSGIVYLYTTAIPPTCTYIN